MKTVFINYHRITLTDDPPTNLFITASAFAPAARVARSSSMKMAFESAEGAQAPLGFWDPLGLLKEADQDRFDRLRFVELKHGRVSMLAVLGHLVTSAGIRFNGQLDLEGHSFADTPAGFAWWDLKGWKQVEGSTPGDFGIPYLKYLKNDEERASKRAIELNNGRAAQMGILAIMIHEKLDGHPYIINDLLGFPFAINQ
jgi:Chlorophyll A-B binding protein